MKRGWSASNDEILSHLPVNQLLRQGYNSGGEKRLLFRSKQFWFKIAPMNSFNLKWNWNFFFNSSLFYLKQLVKIVLQFLPHSLIREKLGLGGRSSITEIGIYLILSIMVGYTHFHKTQALPNYVIWEKI